MRFLRLFCANFSTLAGARIAVQEPLSKPATRYTHPRTIMSPNAFIGSKLPPADDQLTEKLGAARALWDELIAALALPGSEWNSYSPKAGWSLKLKQGKRTIVYLSPCEGCFRVAFILGAKAVAAAHEQKLPKALLKRIDESPRYPEGTGVRFEVTSAKHLADIRKLAALKRAN